jgi:D-alanyl-D-alanine dipeptidase
MEIVKIKNMSNLSKKETKKTVESLEFHSDIQKLREMPVAIDPWAYEQVGKRNDGPFKDNYQSLEVKECGERLVDTSAFGLASEDYYYSRFAGEKEILAKGLISERVFLRESHARRLAKADQYFRERGLFLYIVSGWRHPELQKIIKEEYAEKFGQEKADRLFASIDRKVPAPHSTGGAFDIELRDLATKQKIDMNVYFENERVASLYWAEELMRAGELDSNSAETVKHRRILYHGLCTEGVIFEKKEDLFVGHPGEYWHYGDGDTLSTYLKKEPFIRYGTVYP